MRGGMRGGGKIAENIVQQIAENQIAIAFVGKAKWRVGKVPEIVALQSIWIRHAVAAGRRGMHPHQVGILNDDKIQVLVAFRNALAAVEHRLELAIVVVINEAESEQARA